MALSYLKKDQLIIAEISFKIASESLSGYKVETKHPIRIF